MHFLIRLLGNSDPAAAKAVAVIRSMRSTPRAALHHALMAVSFAVAGLSISALLAVAL